MVSSPSFQLLWFDGLLLYTDLSLIVVSCGERERERERERGGGMSDGRRNRGGGGTE